LYLSREIWGVCALSPVFDKASRCTKLVRLVRDAYSRRAPSLDATADPSAVYSRHGMPPFEDTPLWKRTLASCPGDEAAAARDRLRDAYLAMRERAVAIASAIAADLPDFTVHDESHFDALWEMASLLATDDVPITPTEAFVLGGAFLIHDLGMGLGAFPDGVEELRRRPIWRDSVALIRHRATDAAPAAVDTVDGPEPPEKAVMQAVLRTIHAEQAERIATTPWSAAGGSHQYLIENDDLRATYGSLIGRIAHSHWWPATKLADEFSATLGAPAWTGPECPVSWTLDPLKVAALLRSADAIHLDARRAPRFLRTLRRPTGISEDHWAFQEKLNRPIIERDRVVFTSSTPFGVEDADAWWTCFDVLRQVDRYLLEVDVVLSTASRPRLAARGVAALESSEHLARRIPTSGWQPIDTEIHISDVAHLVRILGGEELYGSNPPVGLRELLQNAGDAVRARRIVEERPENWGEITVSLFQRHGRWLLEVTDTGVGMTRTVMTDILLDFGRSYWTSDLVAEELPGLMGEGFAPVGRYGIGFFSVLMLGHELQVISRPYSAALTDTSVLEFAHGATSRPLLRTAQEDEFLADGGTKVRVVLGDGPSDPGGLLWRWGREPWRLCDLVRSLAPAFEVKLAVQDTGSTEVAVEAHDWLTIEPHELLQRTYSPEYETDSRVEDLLALADNARPITDDDGRVFGRALIHPMSTYAARFGVSDAGVVSVGGLYSTPLDGIAGVLTGRAERAARDLALPTVPLATLAKWSTEQAELLASQVDAPELQAAAAAVVLRCLGDPGHLRICQTDIGWVTQEELVEWLANLDELTILSGSDVPYERARGSDVQLAPNTIWLPYSYTLLREAISAETPEWPPNIHFVNARDYREEDPDRDFPEWFWQERNGSLGLVISLAADRWETTERDILSASTFRFRQGSLVPGATRDGSPFLVEPRAVLRRP
jgi:hypothetical protein